MKEQTGDVAKKEDMCFAVIHLISLEEHLALTAMKTRKEEYLQMLLPVRKLRISLMKELVKNTEGELWCTSKHLLSLTMRLMETAAKYLDVDRKKSSALMEDAFGAYSLFWLLQNIKGGKHVSGRPKKDKKA